MLTELSNAVELYNGVPTTTSIKVAEVFGKAHRSVLNAIRRMTIPEEYLLHNFVRYSYTGTNGKPNPVYRITKDGFVLFVMGFTGAVAMQFKIAYIEAFNEMERGYNSDIQRLEAKIDALTALLTKEPERIPAISEGYPDVDEVNAYCSELGAPQIGIEFCGWYELRDWRTAKGDKLSNWKLAVMSWINRSYYRSPRGRYRTKRISHRTTQYGNNCYNHVDNNSGIIGDSGKVIGPLNANA